ncbi:MAG: AbrB/MazE/SpoVT family DNA-binding domain-containing protein [Candidatus Methanomethylicaceae archaeon]
MKWERVLLFQSGSFRITLPPEVVKEYNWCPGDPLELITNDAEQTIIITKKGKRRE